MLVGIEFGGHHGFTFAAFLAERGYHVVAVPVQATSRTRSLEDNSPRKDDDKDAAQICNLVASGIFVRAPVLDEWTSALRILITERDRLTTEATRLTNRLRGRLDLAWPEFQTQLGDFRWKTPRTVLEAWPLPSDLAATDIRTARRLIQAFSLGHFRPEEVDALRKSAKMTIGLSTALEARRAEIRRLLARWALVREQEAEIDRVLERLVRDRRETIALLTIPEVSALCAATIVAELGPPETYTSPRQVLKLAGLNLARKQSGTSVLGPVRITKRGRWALRSQLYLLAMRWCSSRGLYREQYLAMVARNGGLRKKAVCAMARKLTPLILHILQTGEPFDEATWLAKRAAPAGLRRGRVPAPSVHHAVTPRRS
jgi:transposase